MRKGLLAIAIALTTSGIFAQSSVTANEVCQKIAVANAQNALVCVEMIARNTFSEASLKLAYDTVERSSSSAIDILKITANRRLETNAASTCQKIMHLHTTSGMDCLSLVVDTTPSPEILTFTDLVSNSSSAQAIEALKAGAGAYLYAPLLSICSEMTDLSLTNSISCITIIANKVSMNGSEEVCRTTLAQGSAYAIECLKSIVMDYVPFPEPTTVMIKVYKLQDLKISLLKTRTLLENGSLEETSASIQEALNALDDMIYNSEEAKKSPDA